MRTLRASGLPARAAWTWFIIALTASLGANVATAGLLDMRHVPAVLRVLVAGWPALAFFGGTLLAHNAPATTARPANDAPTTPADPAPVTLDRTPDSAPAPAPELPPAPAPAVAVPAALLDHARKLADAHRSATGQPLDSATLRARLGVPPALADAITAQLA
jgi:hypothetical protein